MAPLPGTPKRRARGVGRPRGRSNTAPDTAPPMKKRKYIPGGPGGGGRYVDTETGLETPVGGTGPGGYAYTGPRGRVGRMNAERGVVAPSTAVSPTATYTRPRRERPAPGGPRASSASAAAAVVAQSDGYKPREERGWEEFHQDLDIEAPFMVFSAHDVDGISPPETNPATPSNIGFGPLSLATNNGASSIMDDALLAQQDTPSLLAETSYGISQDSDTVNVGGSAGKFITPFKRRPGRPPRRLDSMLTGLGSPPAPKIVPIPAHNPKERLNLPKPSYRQVDTFSAYEQDESVQVNYVDRAMENLGYQASDLFIRTKDAELIRLSEADDDLDMVVASKDGDVTGASAMGRVEYDMDEQDDRWLEQYNAQRKDEQVEPIKPALFEITMTQIEKEWHALEKRIPKPNPKPPQTHRPRSSSAAAVNGEPIGAGEEQDSKCAICDDGDCENTNAIVFCDGCDLAVHQECYGVPFIPEGQWLCRKCQLIGRGTPTCIFCPNVDGAFKQTNTSKWSHLLCAIWIPEVSLGNTIFMEPVMDVEKVPRQRWKLTCYICQQKMGACIQCGNKNCFTAFHVTCARRARLFLRMKSSHGTPATMDASILKAFCDKHVPIEWRRENDVERATAEAKAFYRHTMRGRRWADSQTSALTNTASQQPGTLESAEDGAQTDGAANKRKNLQPQKNVWRLPSGAPIIPQAVFHNVENSLVRFSIRKRKEYVGEACKYWTLKREARRGASLLKRLQLQMETFTSMEITRRNFAGMGAIGRPRLERRIRFAEQLETEMEHIRVLCDAIKEREEEKLKDARILEHLMNTVYFPIPPLLWPIFRRAQTLDSKDMFAEGFKSIQQKLEERYYTSVKEFSDDIIQAFGSVINSSPVEDVDELQQQLNGVEGPFTSLTPEQKERRKLAKRITKAIQGMLVDARRKESELALQKHFDKDLIDLDALLDSNIRSHQEAMHANAAGEAQERARKFSLDNVSADGDHKVEARSLSNGINEIEATNGHHEERDTESGAEQSNGQPKDEVTDDAVIKLQLGAHEDAVSIRNDGTAQLEEIMNGTADSVGGYTAPALSNSGSTNPSTVHPGPLTPPRSEKDLLAPLANGGIPWYLETFDPEGTTVYDERWSGREVLRDMSEELSELDDDELNGLADEDMVDAPPLDTQLPDAAEAATVQKAKPKARRRWRGFR